MNAEDENSGRWVGKRLNHYISAYLAFNSIIDLGHIMPSHYRS